jgi:hypothetical protein
MVTAVGDKVLLTEYTPFKSKMELFLAYSENKQNVINMQVKNYSNRDAQQYMPRVMQMS